MANVSMAAAVDSLVEAVKEEQHSEASETKTDSPPEIESESEPQEDQFHFQFLEIPYVDELGSLSSAINAFQWRLNELQEHLGFINDAIGARSKQLISSSKSQQDNDPQPLWVEVEDTKVGLPSHSSTATTSSRDSGKIEGKESVESSSLFELQHLCETMCSRGLRKYIISHLSDLASLRHEIPLALKCAPNPAKLVFDCIGRFYLQGRKAYSKDSPMIPARQASILILELFLLSGAAEAENYQQTQMEPSLKVEAYLAATAWRKRLVTECGSCKATDIDACGLLLFLASFGIPTVFTNHDLRDLLRSSNSKGICSALRRSHAFFTRIPEIVKGMIKNSMNVEAVDIVYAFGLEDLFPPQEILLSFLQECDETWKKRIIEVRGSTIQLRRVNEEKLASLKYVLKCLEDHKLDPVKSLPGWKIHEMIKNLEKDIVELEKIMEDNASMKRKTDEACPQKYLSREIKRSRMAASKGGFSVMSYPVNGLLDQTATTFLEDKSCFSTCSSSSSMQQKLLDGGRAAQLGNYQIASSLREIGGSIYKMELTPHEFAFKDKSAGQSFFRPAIPTLTTTPTPMPPAIEGFEGYTASNHIDLYHFADAVFESDAPKSSSTRTTGSLPRLQPPHYQNPPYFYN